MRSLSDTGRGSCGRGDEGALSNFALSVLSCSASSSAVELPWMEVDPIDDGSLPDGAENGM